ncbi:MAG: flagellar hook-length control protein FliK [Methylocystis sp.]|uniref:flagellar hook-length control protein FliK n=1 Tax=Methylocystis sp. TaxID=1911079 RepID=UPI003DA25E9B
MAQPALPMTIHVSQIQTHFPAMIANTLTSGTPTGGIEDDIQIHRPLEAMDKPKDVQKIVSFEVEPASLGAISVRMRMTHSGVDIQIVAENASTSALLTDTRETLSAAIGERGLRLESYEVVVNVAHPVAAATGAEGGAGGADRQPAFAGERGFTHDDRPGQRPRQNANARRRERISPTSGPIGVIL